MVHKYLCGSDQEHQEAGEKLYYNAFKYLERYINSKSSFSKLSVKEKEDIIYETFATSLERLDYFNGKSTFNTWVVGILKNIYFNRKKKKSLQEIVMPDIDLEDEMNRQTDIGQTINLFGRNPVDILIEKELMDAVEMAYMRLPKNYQDVIKCRDNGMSSKQIALLLDKTPDAVNTMHYKAFVAWKKIFEEIYKI